MQEDSAYRKVKFAKTDGAQNKICKEKSSGGQIARARKCAKQRARKRIDRARNAYYVNNQSNC